MAESLDDGQGNGVFQTQTSCFQFLLVGGAGSAQAKTSTWEPFFPEWCGCERAGNLDPAGRNSGLVGDGRVDNTAMVIIVPMASAALTTPGTALFFSCHV